MLKSDTKKNTATKAKKKSIKYFKVDKFVDDVIEEMKLGDVETAVLLDLQGAIAKKLGDRILATVIGSFKERELKMLENMLSDHPELDELDALWLVAHEVEDLKDRLMREVNSLYSELVYDAEKIDIAMKSNKKNSN